MHLSWAWTKRCLPSVGWSEQQELKDVFRVCIFRSCWALQRLARLWESPGSPWKPHVCSTGCTLMGCDGFGHQLACDSFLRSGVAGRCLSTHGKIYLLVQWWNIQKAHRTSWKFWAVPHCWLISLALVPCTCIEFLSCSSSCSSSLYVPALLISSCFATWKFS